MDTDELVQEIGSLVLGDQELSSWQASNVVLVAQIGSNSSQVNGFAYQETGRAVPTSPDDFNILKKLKELRAAMSLPGKVDWLACVVRINMRAGTIDIDFEYDEPDKWLITPATLGRMAEALRPTK